METKVAVCEVVLTEQTISKKFHASFAFCDSVQCTLLQVELEYARKFEVEHCQQQNSAEGTESGTVGEGITSFKVLLGAKKDWLRLMGILKALKWDLLTAVAYERPDEIIHTFFYSTIVAVENIDCTENGALPSASNVTRADQTTASAKKPRKSISQRFVSLLTPSFGANGKQANETDSSGDALLTSESAPEPTSTSAESIVELGEEHPDGQVTADPGSIPPDDTGETNTTDNSKLEVVVEGSMPLDQPTSVSFDEANSETPTTTPIVSNDDGPGGNAGTPNTRKLPRKSLSQRFGSLLSPNKVPSAESADTSPVVVVAETANHDNPILQRFKSRSEDGSEEPGQGNND